MLLDDMGDYLTSGGAATLGLDLFLSNMPDTPDTCAVIYETGGFRPLHTMSGSTVVRPVAEFPSIQVICRAKSYVNARHLALQVDGLLNGLRNREINGVMYKWVEPIQSPFLAGKDGNNRSEIACNYNIVREAASSS